MSVVDGMINIRRWNDKSSQLSGRLLSAAHGGANPTANANTQVLASHCALPGARTSLFGDGHNKGQNSHANRLRASG